MSDSQHPVRAYRQSQTPAVTLAALAAKIGTSKANLSRIESGKQELTLPLGLKLSAVTGIPLSVLLPNMAEAFHPEPAE